LYGLWVQGGGQSQVTEYFWMVSELLLGGNSVVKNGRNGKDTEVSEEEVVTSSNSGAAG